jgi:carbonic anhydrase
MRLFDSIIAANHRAAAGDASASVPVSDFAAGLPVVALTCIDPRLNGFFPAALGLPTEQFIWLRNAGNIITGPMSSTMRSLALACAVKGGREIAVIGHTDCQVAKTTTSVLLDRLKALGVDRARLPDNVNEFFGTFGSERQNVIKACDFIRSSPIIGPKIPVHGLLIDIASGKLDWVVNGYDSLVSAANLAMAKTNLSTLGGPAAFQDFSMGEMKFPDMKIGDHSLPGKIADVVRETPPPLPPEPGMKKSPLPPIRPKPPLNPHKDFKRG